MVYVLLGTGFEEIEALTPVDLLRRAGVPVQTVGLNGTIVFGGHGIGIQTDITPEEMDLQAMDMLVLPGGLGGVAAIKAHAKAQEAITYAYENHRYLAAICAGPTLLSSLLEGRQAVCYPGCEAQMGKAHIVDAPCIRDGQFLTGASAGCARDFALMLIDTLCGPEKARQIEKQIVIR